MKTSVLYGEDYGRRCFMPEEQKEQGLRTYGVARHVPEHELQVSSFGQKDTRTAIQPESITAGSYRFLVGYHRGVHLAAKTTSEIIKAPVVISDHYVEEIHQLDEDIKVLRRRRQAVMTKAGRAGRPLTVNDFEDGE